MLADQPHAAQRFHTVASPNVVRERGISVNQASTELDADSQPASSSATDTAAERIRAEVGERDIGPLIRAGATTAEAKDAIRTLG
jgi:hypothetical protein